MPEVPEVPVVPEVPLDPEVPLVTYVAKFEFFNQGHRLSGFSPKSIGLVENKPALNMEGK